MASFETAYKILQPHEGGYVPKAIADKIKDSGGETYKGISRVNNPTWAGWKIIDAYKAKNGIPKLNAYIPSKELDELVKTRALKNYWEPLKLSLIKDQAVANLLMDISFNSGPSISAKSLQRVLNVEPDGKVGPITINAANKQKPDELLHKLGEYRLDWLNKYQKGKQYLDVLLKRTASYLKAYKKPVAITGAVVVGLVLTVFF